MIVPLFVGREKSVRALEDVMADEKRILLVAQKNAAQDDPPPEDIYDVGTLSTVLQLLKLPDGTVKVLVEGKSAGAYPPYTFAEEFCEAEVTLLEEVESDSQEIEALIVLSSVSLSSTLNSIKRSPAGGFSLD